MIRWTQREWKLIADWLVRNETDPNRHGWRCDLIKAMQSVLPKDRWRETHSLNNGKEMLIPLMKHLKENLSSAPAPVIPKASEFSTEELLVELARRLAPIIDGRAMQDALNVAQVKHNAAVDRGFHPETKHNPLPESPEQKQRKKRVLIVGPQPAQANRLRSFAPGLDLVFVTTEDKPARCSVGNVECAIIWDKFVTHAQQNTVKSLGYPIQYAHSLEQIEQILGMVR